MSMIASQITGVSKVCSTVCSGADKKFPSQKASNAENVSIWWRHHAQITDYVGRQAIGHRRARNAQSVSISRDQHGGGRSESVTASH